MRFSQAFNPIRALGSTWRMLAAAPAPVLLGSLLLMVTQGGGGGGGSVKWDGSGWGRSLSGPETMLLVGFMLFVLVLSIAFWLFGCLVRVGFATVAEEVLSKGQARIGQLFEGRGRWLDMVLTSLLQGLIAIASMIPFLVLILLLALIVGITNVDGLAGPAAAVGILLFVLYLPLVFYVGLGISLMQPAVAIEGFGPKEALRRSWDLARGHRLELLIYHFVMGVFVVLGLLACCVGVLLTGPMAHAALYESYLRLVRSEEEQATWQLPAG